MKLTRRQTLWGGIAASLAGWGYGAARPIFAQTGGSELAKQPLELFFKQPARLWEEALPVGNGRLGAMCFGGTGTETLQLNEDTLWSGEPYDPSSSEALEALPVVRDLIWQGKYMEAQNLANEKMMAKPIRQMSYNTIGNLIIETEGQDHIHDYERRLSLTTAEVEADWTADGKGCRRRVISSAPHNIMLVEYVSDGEPISQVIRFEDEGAVADGDRLLLQGTNSEEHGKPAALRFAALVEANVDAGHVVASGDRLEISGAQKVVLKIAVRTNYISWKDISGDELALAAADLDAVSALSAEDIISEHRADFASLFEGFDIYLGADPFEGLPTDQRIRFSHEKGNDDPYLAALYTQFARYLLISSSRAGSQPANLQGIWNDSNRPPWGSKYTININTEMNYWPAEPMGLSACIAPLVDMVEELAESGARTARTNYNARGWVCHHNTDLWRATAPIDGAFWGMWQMGGAWLCKHLWDHWDYTGDRAHLERIYPILKGACEFFEDFMVEHPEGDGLVTIPSNSPENAHHSGGRSGVSLCAGPAMDRQILRELFDNTISAAEELGIDDEYRANLAAIRARIPADRIGSFGQLQEWLEDWDLNPELPEIQHRHVSHLYAVYPGHEIGPETPELYEAARRSLEIRGDDATGWGIGWRINLWARLGDSKRAYIVLRKLLGPDRTYPNMFDAHPPFQIDGNFGGAAGILEMLVRDRHHAIELLPALPVEWPAGHVKGVHLRGGLMLDLGWADGKVTSAVLTAKRPVSRQLIIAGKTQQVDLAAGEVLTI
ncbi:MAG: hypothetical protein CMK07_08360 [Ponticaulis sp.]|nr:hypothetical protein [Ponticaulis sp.]